MVKKNGQKWRARRTGLSARRAQRMKSRGLKGLQLEVGARRAPRLLVLRIFLKIWEKPEEKTIQIESDIQGKLAEQGWQAAAHTATRGRGRRCMEERGGKQKYWHLWILIVVKKIDGVSSVSIKECKCEEVKQEDSIYSQFQAKCWLLQSQKTASVAVWRGWSKEYKPKI